MRWKHTRCTSMHSHRVPPPSFPPSPPLPSFDSPTKVCGCGRSGTRRFGSIHPGAGQGRPAGGRKGGRTREREGEMGDVGRGRVLPMVGGSDLLTTMMSSVHFPEQEKGWQRHPDPLHRLHPSSKTFFSPNSSSNSLPPLPSSRPPSLPSPCPPSSPCWRPQKTIPAPQTRTKGRYPPLGTLGARLESTLRSFPTTHPMPR